ncbi:oxidoreductase [Sediminicola luteus]|uniref:Short-chain dehydrogenase n=1 Tax=Sediminicola luteus TaxID=319238 RepID=A0A2A4G4M5_9FLAO|nr:oxidoreductase [Sediminicola luteus]PCE62930.1 hypothetical protein B7P33_16780 [Sediminicola luteus]
MAKHWTAQDIPNQSGKKVLITGGNRGLGFQMALELARKQAQVTLACRSTRKGNAAAERIRSLLGAAVQVEVLALDLNDLESIRDFTGAYKERHNSLDILINNAAVVNLKEKSTNPMGWEMHMATNHLGHFALTAQLYPIIRDTEGARVVTMGSGAHKFGTLDLSDIHWEKRPYDRSISYGDSKLANMLFMRKLQQKFETEGVNAISVGAHPGLSATERQQSIGIGGWLTKIMAQPVSKGVLPALRAATDPEVKGGAYYGPRYMICGYPILAGLDKKALDQKKADTLWELSEHLTRTTF